MAKENFTQGTGATQEEIAELAAGIAASTSAAVVRIACLWFMCRWATRKQIDTGVPPDEIAHIQAECENAWLTQKGITRDAVMAAVAAMERAHDTVAYLDSLPA